MLIPLRNYDTAAAKQRIHALVDRERGLGWDSYSTDMVRSLHGAREAVACVGYALVNALAILPIGEGGTATGEGAWLHEVKPEMPLVQALMICRGHPCHPGFGHMRFERPGQSSIPTGWHDGLHDIGPVLERMYAASPRSWDLARLEAIVFEGAIAAYGDEEIDSSWLFGEIYPGSQISKYMGVLLDAAILDAFGAFDPSFSRQDALSGEWWLLQPVSPRLQNGQLARQLGLTLAGHLPPRYVDVPGRAVMVCFAREPASDEARMDRIRDSKWIAGATKVVWDKGHAPLSDPGFELIPRLEGVTEDSYGPYKHSSELPPWPPRDTGAGAP